MTTLLRVDVGKGAKAETFWLSIEDHRVEAADVADATEPDFAFIVEPAVLDELRSGELAVDVGYMQGRVKLTGNVGRFLDVLPLLTDESFRSALPSPGS